MKELTCFILQEVIDGNYVNITSPHTTKQGVVDEYNNSYNGKLLGGIDIYNKNIKTIIIYID